MTKDLEFGLFLSCIPMRGTLNKAILGAECRDRITDIHRQRD